MGRAILRVGVSGSVDVSREQPEGLLLFLLFHLFQILPLMDLSLAAYYSCPSSLPLACLPLHGTWMCVYECALSPHFMDGRGGGAGAGGEEGPRKQIKQVEGFLLRWSTLLSSWIPSFLPASLQPQTGRLSLPSYTVSFFFHPYFKRGSSNSS